MDLRVDEQQQNHGLAEAGLQPALDLGQLAVDEDQRALQVAACEHGRDRAVDDDAADRRAQVHGRDDLAGRPVALRRVDEARQVAGADGRQVGLHELRHERRLAGRQREAAVGITGGVGAVDPVVVVVGVVVGAGVEVEVGPHRPDGGQTVPAHQCDVLLQDLAGRCVENSGPRQAKRTQALDGQEGRHARERRRWQRRQLADRGRAGAAVLHASSSIDAGHLGRTMHRNHTHQSVTRREVAPTGRQQKQPPNNNDNNNNGNDDDDDDNDDSNSNH